MKQYAINIGLKIHFNYTLISNVYSSIKNEQVFKIQIVSSRNE